MLARISGLFLVCFCGYAFLETQSRGGTIALLGAIVGLGFHRARMRRSGVLLVPMIVLTVGLTQVLSLIGGFLDRFRIDDVETMADRMSVWREGLDAFLNASVVEKLLGRGLGAADFDTGLSPHNSGLRILLDQGLLGLALCAMLLIIALAGTWRRRDDVGVLQFGLLVFAVLGSLSIEPHYFLPAFGILLGVSLAALPGAVLVRDAKPQILVRATSP